MSDNDRGFGRYLDQDRRDRPHGGGDDVSGVEESEQQGNDTEHVEHRPPPRTGGRLGRSAGRDNGFGRYVPD